MLETIYSDRCQNLNSHFLTISSLKEEIYCSKKVDPWPCQFLKKMLKNGFLCTICAFMFCQPFQIEQLLGIWRGHSNILIALYCWVIWVGVILHPLYTTNKISGHLHSISNGFFMILFFRCFTLRLGKNYCFIHWLSQLHAVY